jgi:hypothetical protein
MKNSTFLPGNKKLLEVDKAQPYNCTAMGTFGNASGMLIKQFKFPLTFESEKDKINVAFLDRIEGWRMEEAQNCLKKYGLAGHGIHFTIREMSDQKVFDFVCEIMQVERSSYTGFRILGGVQNSGHPWFCFQLFAKHPDTDTQVFSGDDAPNVQTK